MFDGERRLIKAQMVVERAVEKYGDNGMLPPRLPAQEAMDIIKEHLLGDGWYVNYPAGAEQINTEIVYEIIRRYRPDKWTRK